MTSSDDMLYCYLLDIVSHLQPLSHRCQLSFNASKCLRLLNAQLIISVLAVFQNYHLSTVIHVIKWIIYITAALCCCCFGDRNVIWSVKTSYTGNHQKFFSGRRKEGLAQSGVIYGLTCELVVLIVVVVLVVVVK